MEGMLQALEPQVKLSQGKALSPRLQALLQKRSLDVNKISSRLEQLQQNKIANPQPDTAKAVP
jgi:glycerate kinase